MALIARIRINLSAEFAQSAVDYSALTVQLINFARRHSLRANAVVRQLLAVGIDIDPARVFDVGIDVHDVNVEDERLLAGGGEPVDIVLVVGNGRVLAGGKRAVDRGADDHE